MPATTDNDVAEYRGALDEELNRTSTRIDGLQSQLDDFAAAARVSATEDEHDDDSGIRAMERTQTEEMLRAAQDHLDEVRAAMRRLAAGTYGICENCGRPISKARLLARPTARLCIDCASRH